MHVAGESSNEDSEGGWTHLGDGGHPIADSENGRSAQLALKDLIRTAQGALASVRESRRSRLETQIKCDRLTGYSAAGIAARPG